MTTTTQAGNRKANRRTALLAAATLAQHRGLDLETLSRETTRVANTFLGWLNEDVVDSRDRVAGDGDDG